jgi:hypothetical protein
MSLTSGESKSSDSKASQSRLSWGVRFTIAVTVSIISWGMEYSWRNGISFPAVNTLSERLWQLTPFFLVSIFSIFFPLWALFLIVEVLSLKGTWGRLVSILLMITFSIYMLNSILIDRLGSGCARSIRWLYLVVFVAAILLIPLLIMRLKRWVIALAIRGEYDRALRINKTFSWLANFNHSYEGWILSEAGRYAEAMAFFKPQAFANNGQPLLTSWGLYMYSSSLLRSGEKAAAQELFEAAVKEQQRELKEYFSLALADSLLAQKKEADRARDLIAQVIADRKASHPSAQQSVESAHTTCFYAYAQAFCRQREEALALLQEAMADSSGFKKRDLAALQHIKGLTWQVLGDPEKAKAEFEESIALHPHGDIAVRTQRKLAELASKDDA